ncbi:xanthine dehydrogenase family protein molybdopterin-binding subunit [Candidatus Entotheonella palauensis]|uniref:xanthine dehydrogenase family protein molybdopterin-binding subunit n=1 Tax=Candidatus Entotheonella palauensis TaxID=93172 RepID=UPI0015C4C88D|nr:xanthine dehydrogenase family protein molybdopterin-binding subunit [Candidatus Entotheonella palauensis]
MAPYIGRSLKRFEDPRLLVGEGRFVDDMQLPDMLHAVVLRSPHAHARIVSIEAASAKALHGVVTVLTARELTGKVRDIPRRVIDDLSGVELPEHPVLAGERACYVGQPVAVVVAESRALAEDAAEQIEMAYEPLTPVIDLRAACEDGTALVHDETGTNTALQLRLGRGDVDAAFAAADHVVQGRYEVPRLSAAPMEGRGLIARYQSQEQQLTLWTSTQVAFKVKRFLAQTLMEPPRQLRVITPDVGGGFGQKVELWPEEVACSYLAMTLQRPIKWVETRRENLLAYHGRGYCGDVEAAVRSDGRILAVRCHILADLGAYSLNATPGPPVNAAKRVAGPYDIADMDVECLGIMTNKPPTGPYRGAGGPEGAFFMERTVDLIARELHLDPAEVRRRNFIASDAFPYTTGTGLTYDSGQFEAVFARALELADYEEMRQRQREWREGEPRLGIGIATVVKASGGQGEMLNSNARVRVEPTGEVTVYTEVSPHGQGTETTFSQMVADTLGIEPEQVVVRHGDTDMLPWGQGTFASRGLSVGGSAMYEALQQVRQQLANVAAEHFECTPQGIGFRNGKLINSQNPLQTMAFEDAAASSSSGLECQVEFGLPDNPFGFAAHVVVVEIDPETGALRLLRYAAVHDSGRIINPKLFEGQVYGAIAQGLGQALGEGMHYSTDGQPLTGSFLDYVMPRAKEMLPLRVEAMETPSPTNPLGLKGVGELPTVACPVAVVNAVLDALSDTEVRHLDAPVTQEKIWRAMHQKA